ncbi:A-kinase anchor protein inhibitor 1 [Vidua macroura]|uniref:A-kinase anchor protein inhibitor 1 n=1 Tax=Vidua macroura TaxID=187451 RepID=UPI0023A7C92F|nr:A-kinase anchor protein inhibitor 1 [Vidua macroura]
MKLSCAAGLAEEWDAVQRDLGKLEDLIKYNKSKCKVLHMGEKPGTEQDEVKLQIASKQIVQTAILRAVQQVSQESQQKEKRTNTATSLQLERGKLTKKHEKK